MQNKLATHPQYKKAAPAGHRAPASQRRQTHQGALPLLVSRPAASASSRRSLAACMALARESEVDRVAGPPPLDVQPPPPRHAGTQVCGDTMCGMPMRVKMPELAGSTDPAPPGRIGRDTSGAVAFASAATEGALGRNERATSRKALARACALLATGHSCRSAPSVRLPSVRARAESRCVRCFLARATASLAAATAAASSRADLA